MTDKDSLLTEAAINNCIYCKTGNPVIKRNSFGTVHFMHRFKQEGKGRKPNPTTCKSEGVWKMITNPNVLED